MYSELLHYFLKLLAGVWWYMMLLENILGLQCIKCQSNNTSRLDHITLSSSDVLPDTKFYLYWQILQTDNITDHQFYILNGKINKMSYWHPGACNKQ